jgi:phage head maturation protease
MHNMVAAGVVVEGEIDAKNRFAIVAKVVDTNTIKKLRAGVFRGFSIGGKTLARDPKNRKVITKSRLDEISLVDRPANPEATLDVWKAAGERGNDVVLKATAAVNFLENSIADIASRLTKIEESDRRRRS